MNEVLLALDDRHRLLAHLFPGDRDEHAAIVLAGLHQRPDGLRLLGRELHLLGPDEFIPGEHGYRQLAPHALARLGNRAAEQHLALVSCHSHPGATTSVGLSADDLAGHKRVFPHLLDIVDGVPVAGLALGTDSAAGELWLPRREPLPLDGIRTIGPDLRLKGPRPTGGPPGAAGRYDRQARMFGAAGQQLLAGMSVGIVGLGGGGSLLSEQLTHLGVGKIVAIDFDVIKEHNLSRIVGAKPRDADRATLKVEVARRLAERIDPSVVYEAVNGDIADADTAGRLKSCDYIFLATDSMTSRLVANALAQAYFIPVVQIGAKVDLDENGEMISVYVACRPVLPGQGCLECAGMIDPDALQREGVTEQERQAQNYLGLREVIDPSVITLNGVAASAASNTMLMSAVGLAGQTLLSHRLFDAQHGDWLTLAPERDPKCVWCSKSERSRFAQGDAAVLPLRPGPIVAPHKGLWARWRAWWRRWRP